jgi:glyoxylase-like metal-dependent hydrolase (beta-lactamase superfamily II)
MDQTSHYSIGSLENNVWIVWEESNAFIFDAPNGAAQQLATEISGAQVAGIGITHGHFDHIDGAPQLRESAESAPVYLHPHDQFLWQQQHPHHEPDHELSHGDELYVGDRLIQVLHTPGHTPGSTCYHIPSLGIVITGDTLFPCGPGATRWQYSDFDQIIESIDHHLFTLNEDTRVLPGHGPTTTIGTEKPKLSGWRERGW